MMDPELVALLACPRCKGRLSLDAHEGGLTCPACRLRYPIRNGVPVLLIEEAHDASRVEKGSPVAQGFSATSVKVRFLVVEGKNKGEVLELEKGSCRAMGRSLDDAEKTRAFSLESVVTLDEASKKLVMSYIAKQFHKGLPSGGQGEAVSSAAVDSLGAFRREADIYFRDGAVSRLHAMVFYDEAGVGILDLVSKNGTFVNGMEVESKLLKPGDLVAVGTTKMRLE